MANILDTHKKITFINTFRKTKMNKKNILEIIGLGFLVIAALSYLSEKFNYMESLAEIYNYRDLMLFLGFGIHLIGGYQQEKLRKKEKNK
ncbi:hypothetical protein [Olleya namhaensis]|uniref:hypothetical protein n=1 Tax=Olleya namhaensis TaxID=1144750 RepID=UPI00232BF025|nr:hypothetical protein [Olleya namhaensis]